MKSSFPYRQRGIAMVVVLWVILVLSLLISGFAFRMHVETQVASFSRKELKAQMLARAGLEVARMQLILHDRSTEPNVIAFGQEWATNELYAAELGDGTYNVKVFDEEGKLPVNRLSPEQWKRLMEVLDIDPLDADVIVDSVLDWIDDNDLHRLNGAEDDYYAQLEPPYRAKNRPLDRIEELLLVRGVTREIFEGIPAEADDEESGRPGLRDLLTTFSQGTVNVNTAPPHVLQALFGLDDLQIGAVMARRDGQDGVPGTDDDQPFRSVDEFFALFGNLDPRVLEQARALVSTQSGFFRVESTGEWGGVKYTILAILRRQGGDAIVANWRQLRGGS